MKEKRKPPTAAEERRWREFIAAFPWPTPKRETRLCPQCRGWDYAYMRGEREICPVCGYVFAIHKDGIVPPGVEPLDWAR